MIVPMKKITVLTLASGREGTLHTLQNLGVLHLASAVLKGEDTEPMREKLAEIDAVLGMLDAVGADPAVNAKPIQSANAGEALRRLLDLRKEAQTDKEQIETLSAEEERLLPFGVFDPTRIIALEKQGIKVTLASVPRGEPLPSAAGCVVSVLSERRDGTYIALISDKDIEETNLRILRVPDRSLDAVRAAMSLLKQQEQERDEHVRSLVSTRDALLALRSATMDKMAFFAARDSMAASGSIALLEGFVPFTLVKQMESAAQESGWGLLIRDPLPGDTPPTLVQYPAWIRPIKAVTAMLGILPGYREADIGAVFLIFFSVFFAMLIGDAGYGALVLLAVAAARRKWPRAPAYPFALFGILGVATLLWGMMTGNYFGIPASSLPSWLLSLRVPWLTGPDAYTQQMNLMKLCFFIGAVHLSIAHLWNAIALYPSKRALAQFGWIAIVWTMFMTASWMVLAEARSPLLFPALTVGILLVAAFMTPLAELKTQMIHHFMLPLSVVSCFVDVVSYLRLFAVGMASLQVAQSFNTMAVGLDMHPALKAPLFALILLAGHGLNIVLCALGILVHGVRLNTLEFSQHKGLEWAGFPYKPFQTTTSNEI